MIENKDQPFFTRVMTIIWNYKDDIDKNIDRYEYVYMGIYMCAHYFPYLLS